MNKENIYGNCHLPSHCFTSGWLIGVSNFREVSTLFRRLVGLSHRLQTQFEDSRKQRTLEMVVISLYNMLEHTEAVNVSCLLKTIYIYNMYICTYIYIWIICLEDFADFCHDGGLEEPVRTSDLGWDFYVMSVDFLGFTVNSSKQRVVDKTTHKTSKNQKHVFLVFGDAWNKVDEQWDVSCWDEYHQISWSNRLGDFTLWQGKAWLLQLHPSKQLVW